MAKSCFMCKRYGCQICDGSCGLCDDCPGAEVLPENKRRKKEEYFENAKRDSRRW